MYGGIGWKLPGELEGSFSHRVQSDCFVSAAFSLVLRMVTSTTST